MKEETLKFEFPKKRNNWSKQDNAKLISMHKDGVPVDTLSDIFNRSNNAIRSRILQNGLSSSKFNKTQGNNKPKTKTKDLNKIKKFLSQAWYKRIFSKLK